MARTAHVRGWRGRSPDARWQVSSRAVLLKKQADLLLELGFQGAQMAPAL